MYIYDNQYVYSDIIIMLLCNKNIKWHHNYSIKLYYIIIHLPSLSFPMQHGSKVK